jgi:inner membrane transporter RhtA
VSADAGVAMNRAVVGAAMIVACSVAIQTAAAVAHDLFDRLGPTGVSALRFGLGALVLLAIARPAVRGRDAATWKAIVAYGVSLALLNVTFFEAIDRIPMGIAVTLAFVGPLAMALAASRRRRDVGIALLAAAGVLTLGGLDRPGSMTGVVLAMLTGCAWVAVAYAGRSVGSLTRRVDGLALALPIAALLTLPLGAGEFDKVDGRTFALALLIGVGGLIVPFALELEGLRRLEPRIVAVVYSVDPGIAAVVGFLALDERLTLPQIVALVAVMAASVGTTASVAEETEPVAATTEAV